MSEAARVVASVAGVRPDRPGPTVVGVAGAVSVGKSTLADELRHELPGRVDVVSSDGFLFPNAVLAARGLIARKGFPESYDVGALRAFLSAARRDALPCSVPVYSHVTYDVEGERTVDPADVVIVEGLNVLGAAADLLDVGVYLDAAEEQLEAWYRRRFHELVAEAEHDPASFYRGFVGLDPAHVDRVADEVWNTVNLVNLREHVAPSQVLASCVITLGPDHEVLAVDHRPARMAERS